MLMISHEMKPGMDKPPHLLHHGPRHSVDAFTGPPGKLQCHSYPDPSAYDIHASFDVNTGFPGTGGSSLYQVGQSLWDQVQGPAQQQPSKLPFSTKSLGLWSLVTGTTVGST